MLRLTFMDIGGYVKATIKTIPQILEVIFKMWPSYVLEQENNEYFFYENMSYQSLIEDQGVTEELSDKVIYVIDKKGIRYVIAESESHQIMENV